MKNVTLSAEEHLIEQARLVAQARHTTLNEAFRQWLATYTAEPGNLQEFDAFIGRVGAYAKAGGHFTRDQLNDNVPRFFLDSNILIYQFDETAPTEAARATQLVRTALQTGEGIISYQVVQEFINAATKRFRVPMHVNDIRHCISTFLRPMTAIESSPMLFVDALNIFERHKFSWYDSLIAAAAVQGECEILYSEDMQDGFRLGAMRIVNPF